MRGGYVYKSKFKGRRSLCIAALFFSERSVYESEFARIVGLIDEISIKRIHIAEKIRGHFLSICLQSQLFITPTCYAHIRNDKCPNDSRRIMPFVSSVPF